MRRFLRGNQVDAVRLDDHPLFGLVDAHARVARQQLVHHAAVIGREMLNDDKARFVSDGMARKNSWMASGRRPRRRHRPRSGQAHQGNRAGAPVSGSSLLMVWMRPIKSYLTSQISQIEGSRPMREWTFYYNHAHQFSCTFRCGKNSMPKVDFPANCKVCRRLDIVMYDPCAGGG